MCFYYFCIPTKNSGAPGHQRGAQRHRPTGEVLAVLGMNEIQRLKHSSTSVNALSFLYSWWPPVYRTPLFDFQGPKNIFLLMQKSQNGARELRALSPRSAQQLWLVGLVCVGQFTFPQRNKHCACHFIGVDEGNKFYLTLLSFKYTLCDSLLICVALYITQSHDGGPKSVSKACRDVSDFLILLQASVGHKWLEFSTAAMYTCCFLSGRVPHSH